MTFCQYGCGQPAIHYREPSKKLPEGKWTCAKSPLSCPAVKARRFATNVEKYGAANVFAVIHHREEFSEISQAMRHAASDRMADESRALGFRNPETLKKTRETCLNRYGVENPFQLPEVLEKCQKTSLERYGVSCPAALHTQYQRSRIADQWLDEYGLSDEQREVWVNVGGRRIKVDGYDVQTNTIYEFWGDYWHGNPRRFPSEMINRQAHKTMGELYRATEIREALLREQGFSVVTMWEDDFRRQR